MGNAFTFELETLIFHSLALAVCDHLGLSTTDVTTFGDDVILPKQGVDLFYRVLRTCGFIPNQEKSFSDGPFRESCGTDWLRGIDIRPYYQKKLVSGRTLFVYHNYLMRNFEFSLARKVLRFIHPSLIHYGPNGYGDGHLIGSYEPRRKPHHVRAGYDGVIFNTYASLKRRIRRPLPGDRILPAYSIYATSGDEPTDHFAVRGERGYKMISIYTLTRGIFL